MGPWKRIELGTCGLAVQGIVACFFFERADTANAGTEYNTDSVQILILDIKTGVAYRLLGHGDGILGIQVHLAGFLAVDVLVGIEVLHFACELGLE